MSGDNANLRQDGTAPFCAMMQIAAEDTYDDYVICRGFDPRILKFIDYAAGNADKPGISVAKPFGKRTAGTYEIAEVYPAFLPTQGNAGFSDFRQVIYTPPSPSSVNWRVGQNPGKVTGGGLDGGQPAELTDTIEVLYDHNGKVVNWLLIDSNDDGGIGRIEFTVTSATTVDDTDSPYDGMRELTVTVVGPSCNRASLLGETGVKVYEHDPQCLTSDETDEALEDRKGWAYEGIFQDQSSGASPGDATPCHWILDGICCPDGGGGGTTSIDGGSA